MWQMGGVVGIFWARKEFPLLWALVALGGQQRVVTSRRCATIVRPWSCQMLITLQTGRTCGAIAASCTIPFYLGDVSAWDVFMAGMKMR